MITIDPNFSQYISELREQLRNDPVHFIPERNNHKLYYYNNRDKILEWHKNYNMDPEVRERRKEKARQYQRDHPEYRKTAYLKMRNDPIKYRKHLDNCKAYYKRKTDVK